MEIQGNCKLSFAALSAISVHQAHWHQMCFSNAHFRPAHVWEVKMGACWYWVLRLLVSGVLLSGTQCSVVSDEMHRLQQARRGCPLLPLGRDFFSSEPSPPIKLVSRFQEKKFHQKKEIFVFFLKSKKQVNIRMFIIFMLFPHLTIASKWQQCNFFFLVPVRSCWGWALALEGWGTTSHFPAPSEAGVPSSSHPWDHVLPPCGLLSWSRWKRRWHLCWKGSLQIF